MNMIKLGTCLITSIACFARTAFALKADIRADSNRDGVVDITGETDLVAKSAGDDSMAMGALFLPSIGDTPSRCHSVDQNGLPLTGREMGHCHDASGDELYAPEYLASIKVLPIANASNAATANITVKPDQHQHRVRLFLNEGGDWRFINRHYVFNASQIRSGLSLGIDSRELVTDLAIWDGAIRVCFNVQDGNDSASDETILQLAPVLLHHHLQSAETWVAGAPNDISPALVPWIEELDQVRQDIGLENDLLLLNGTSNGFFVAQNGESAYTVFTDYGIQDFLEPAFSSIPGPNGTTTSIRIMLRSPQPFRHTGRLIFERLRGKGTGGYEPEGGLGHEEINSYGNIETLPPYTSATSGKYFPAGRTIFGTVYDKRPIIETFLRAQRMQDPISIDMSWTAYGHVDEAVTFIPYNNSRGWTIAVPDVDRGLDVLRDADRQGFGSVKAFSKSEVSVADIDNDITIEQLLDLTGNDPNSDSSSSSNSSDLLETQAYARRFINASTATIQSEVGIPDSEVVRVPALFAALTGNEPDLHYYLRPDGLQPLISPPPPGKKQLVALYPNAVNGVVFGADFVVAKSWGPVVNGTDIFQEAVRSAYEDEAGLRTHFVNTIETIHTYGGEVHCATNVFRDATERWW